MTAATNASAMPVLPLVGSMSTVLPGVILPAFSAASIMAKPMRSFTLDSGVLAFQLGDDGCGQTCRHAVETHQGGVPDQFSHICSNARHHLLLCGSGNDTDSCLRVSGVWVCAAEDQTGKNVRE